MDAIIAVGGEGTPAIAAEFVRLGFPVVGVPKTIDNDLAATELTFGFMTALDIATEALDRLHTTAESHDRVMVLEVMGRHAGWIALHSGLAGGADVILILKFLIVAEVAERVAERERAGRSRLIARRGRERDRGARGYLVGGRPQSAARSGQQPARRGRVASGRAGVALRGARTPARGARTL